jgi:hypothetical protein
MGSGWRCPGVVLQQFEELGEVMRMERRRKTIRWWHSPKWRFGGGGGFNPDGADGRLRTRSQAGRGVAREVEREEGEVVEMSGRRRRSTLLKRSGGGAKEGGAGPGWSHATRRWGRAQPDRQAASNGPTMVCVWAAPGQGRMGR